MDVHVLLFLMLTKAPEHYSSVTPHPFHCRFSPALSSYTANITDKPGKLHCSCRLWSNLAHTLSFTYNPLFDTWLAHCPLHYIHTLHTYTTHIHYTHTLHTYTTYIHYIHTIVICPLHYIHTLHTYTTYIHYIHTIVICPGINQNCILSMYHLIFLLQLDNQQTTKLAL